MPNAFETINPSGGGLNAFERINPEPSAIQKIASSVPVQFGLGVAKSYTWPADIAKLLSYGGALETLAQMQEDAYESGQPFDINIAKEAIQKGMNYFPTQEAIEREVGKATGIELAPQGPFGKLARSAGNIYGLTRGGGGLIGEAKSLGGSIVGAGVGEGTKPLLEAVGVPEQIAEPVGDIVGFATGAGLKAAKLLPKALGGAQQEARSLAEAYGLRKFRGLESEKLPGKIKASETVAKKAEEELQETSKKAVEKVVTKSLPMKELADRGVDLKAKYTSEYQLAQDLAKKDTRLLDTADFGDAIDKKIEEIVNKSPVPSVVDEKVIGVLKREKDLAREPITYSQLMQQHHNYNANTAKIWKKPEFAGAEKEVIKTYEELKGELRKLGESGGNKEIMSAFDSANDTFKNVSILNQTEGILEEVFDGGYDPKVLHKILKSKTKRGFLKRNLGEGAVKDLENIARYGNMARENIFGRIPKPATANELKNELGIWGNLLLSTGNTVGDVTTLGLPKLSSFIRNRMIMDDGVRKGYIQYLKDISKTGSKEAVRKASARFSSLVEKKLGSPQDVLESFEKTLDTNLQEPPENDTNVGENANAEPPK